MKRIVIKIGTSTLTGGGEGPDRVFINSVAAQVAAQRAQGRQVVLVTSGAIRAGVSELRLSEKPRTIPQKQAVAAIGQGALMHLYADIFANYGVPVGQVLLTRDDLRQRTRYLNARNTFEALLRYDALPVVNENDTVATDEIRVGDNDTLAALVASQLNADALLLLSDVKGLHDKDPTLHSDARLIERVEAVDAGILAMAGPSKTREGTGGMRTKLAAARIVTGCGAAMWIAQGRRPDIISACLAHTPGAGTYFAPKTRRPNARKRWIAWGEEPRGTVVVNTCARRALEEQGRSLLPVGVVGVQGDFQPGDLVSVADEGGVVFARGLACYAAGDISRIAGKSTLQIAAALTLPDGERPPQTEVIHRDHLVLDPHLPV